MFFFSLFRLYKEINNIRNNNNETINSSVSSLLPLPSPIAFPELNFPQHLTQSILQYLLDFLQKNMASNNEWPRSNYSNKKLKKKDDQLSLIDFVLFLGILSIQIAPSIEFDDDKFENLIKIIDKFPSFNAFYNINA